MKRKDWIAVVLLAACAGAGWRYVAHARASHRPRVKRDIAEFYKSVAGFKVRLVAVVDSSGDGQARAADHAWTPDGFPYSGPDQRVSRGYVMRAASTGTQRTVDFELEQIKAVTRRPGEPYPMTMVGVIAYLPKSGPGKDDRAERPGVSGPFQFQIWHGVLRDLRARLVTPPPPTPVDLGFGVEDTDPQPGVFGIAQGEYKVIASGPASVAGLSEGQTTTLSSGNWGRIEATHLRRPMVESKPAPTHRFRLLGGVFPPKTEREVFFYDSAGKVVATCGDGPNNVGYGQRSYRGRTGAADMVRFEVQERPYEFVQFDNVWFEAPQLNGYSGQEGLDHAVDSSVGKFVGVLKSTSDRGWSSINLFSADGTRWIDPGQEFAVYEHGEFDASTHPSNQQWSLLFQPTDKFLTASPVKCEIYASDSATGPSKEQLMKLDEMTIRSPTTVIQFSPTKRPFIRVEMQAGLGAWKPLETIAVDDRMLRTAESGTPGSRVLEVFFDDSGCIRVWKDDEPIIKSSSTWRPKEQRIRAIAHLRDGSTADVGTNMGGYSGVPPNGKGNSGLEYTRQLNGTRVQSGVRSFDFKGIASFEIQVQDYTPPVTVVLHAPVD